MRTLALAATLAGLATICATPAAAYSDQQISQGLMANAWCSFSYNKVSGYSKSQRGVFTPDGMLTVSSNREGGSSGPNGSVYGQAQGGETYQWRVQGGQLLLGQDGEWESFTLDAKQNSNGSIILIVDGAEWSVC